MTTEHPLSELAGSITVPANTGIEGFLLSIKAILKLPRVKEIHVTDAGVVSYKYFARVEETNPVIGVNFDHLEPYHIIRSGTVDEVLTAPSNALEAIDRLFTMADSLSLFPVAFVTGAGTDFWRWYAASIKQERLASHSTLYGYPFIEDKVINPNVLILTTAYGKGGALVDVRRSFKLLIPTTFSNEEDPEL